MADVKCRWLSLAASIVSFCHIFLVFIVAFGWFIPFMYVTYLHGVFLFITWWSWVFSGSCVMAKWEYKLRSVCTPGVEQYSNGYLNYHFRKLTGYAPPIKFIRFWGLVYLSLGLILWISIFFNFLA